MGASTFNSEEAVTAMKNAIRNNEDLVRTVNSINKKVENNFVDGEAVGGAGGQLAAQSFNDTVAAFFDLVLLPSTDNFISDKIKPIIEKNNEFLDSSNNDFAEYAKHDSDYKSDTKSSSTDDFYGNS